MGKDTDAKQRELDNNALVASPSPHNDSAKPTQSPALTLTPAEKIELLIEEAREAGSERDRAYFQLVLAMKLFGDMGLPDDGLYALLMALKDATVGILDPIIRVERLGGSLLSSRIRMMRANCLLAVRARTKRDSCSAAEARRRFIDDLTEKERCLIFPRRPTTKSADKERCCDSLRKWDLGFRADKRSDTSVPNRNTDVAQEHYRILSMFIEGESSTTVLDKIYQTALGQAKQFVAASSLA